MLTYTRNTLFGLVGISLVSLAAAPAQAQGWKNNNYRHGPRVVKVVEKIVYVQPRETRNYYRRDRRWVHRPVATRVVYHNTVVTRPSYYRGNNATAGSVIGAVLGGLTGNAIARGRGKVPAILVGGSYLGALSHTLTALAALQSRGIPIEKIVVSETTGSNVPLTGTRDTVARLVAPVPVETLAFGAIPELPGLNGPIRDDD